MPKKTQETIDSAFRYLGERLSFGTNRPNVYGYRPHAKQYAFHSATERLKLYIGGNRSGKTVGGIVEDVLWATGRHPYRPTPPPPTRGRIISVDFTDGIDKIIKPELMRWLPLSELKGSSWELSYNKEMQQLTLANGSTIDFMSYQQSVEKFAGVSRDWIHFDEEPPKDIFIENLLRVADCGGSMWITMTPLLGMTWVYTMVYEPGLEYGTMLQEDPNIAPLSCRVIEVDISENPYLSEGEIQTIVGSLDVDEREARAHGKFVRLGGLVYKDFDPNPGGLHVLSEYPEIPRDWVWAASVDHGYNNPTAWLWHAISPEGSIITFKEHYASGLVIEQHAERVHEINKELGRAPDYYIGDPSIRNTDAITRTSIHQEYVKYGIPIILGINDVRAGIVRTAGYLRPDNNGRTNWHVTQNCNNLIRELKGYRWKTYANKKLIGQNNALEEPHKKDDHAPDSLRYFIMSRPDLTSDYAARQASEQNLSEQMRSMIDSSVAVPAIGATPSDFKRDTGKFVSDYNDSTQWLTEDGGDQMGSDW